MKTSILKPGLLVALKSTVSGGVEYRRTDLDAAGNVAPEGTQVTRWETTCVISDASEHERAVKCRAQAIALIRAVCSPTSFGLLCSEDRESDLDAAIASARLMASNFNADAKYTRVAVYAMKGRIASTDEEAARAISDEVTSLLQAMDRGIATLDVKAIRDAATKAQELGAMLGDDQVRAVSEAVEQARKAARTIVKRVEKEGEDAAKVLQDIQRGAIERARFAFLDTEETAPSPDTSAMPAVNVARFADLETGDTEPAPANDPPAGVESPSGETLAASEAV